MITFTTNSPYQLLAALKEAIRAGHITTWSDVNGDFTHTPAQWARQAWLRPSVQGTELRFAIIKSQGFILTTEVYAVYHGRFVEMMLAHFDQKFSSGVATAMPTPADRIAA
jgi:hypothetical protein